MVYAFAAWFVGQLDEARQNTAVQQSESWSLGVILPSHAAQTANKGVEPTPVPPQHVARWISSVLAAQVGSRRGCSNDFERAVCIGGMFADAAGPGKN